MTLDGDKTVHASRAVLGAVWASNCRAASTVLLMCVVCVMQGARERRLDRLVMRSALAAASSVRPSLDAPRS